MSRHDLQSGKGDPLSADPLGSAPGADHSTADEGVADAKSAAGQSGEDQFAELLSACDQALAAGTPLSQTVEQLAATDPELATRLARATGCLERLQRTQEFCGSEVQSAALAPGGNAAATVGAEGPLPGGLARAHCIGRFEVIQELGRGGFGIVYLAYDPALERIIALKVPRPEVLISPELKERFLREAKAAAPLNHRNLMGVYEAGEAGPVCWIAEEYCQGESLAERLQHADRPIQVVAAARVVAELAEAVQHAHEHGVMHRDLKPSNVILTAAVQKKPQAATGEDDLAGVTPKLTDFGLAKLMDQESPLTRTGLLLGTPSYMAPEQADEKYGPIGPPTDIYGLGAVLYEMLTGRPPLRGATNTDTLRQVLLDEPLPPTRLRRGLPKDLEAICLKCLEKNSSRRYATASELAADLRRFVAGEPTHARPLGPVQKSLKWSRRHLTAVAALAVTALLLTIIIAGGSWQLRRLRQALSANRQLYQTTVQQQEHQQREHYLSDIRLAERLWHEGKLAQTEQLLAKYIPPAPWSASPVPETAIPATAHVDAADLGRRNDLDQGPSRRAEDHRDFAWHYLWQRCHGQLTTYRGHTGDVCTVAFSPDGAVIATGGSDGTVRLFDTRSGRNLAVLKDHEGAVNSVVFTPDGQILATGADDGSVRLWDVKTTRTLAVFRGHDGDVLSLAVAPDGQTLVSGGLDGTIRLWDIRRHRLIHLCHAHSDWVRAVALSPDGQRLISGSEDGTLKLWNINTTLQLQMTIEHDSWVMAVAFGPKGDLIATGTKDHRLRLWEAETGSLVTELFGCGQWIRDVAISSDGKFLAAVANEDLIRVWSLKNMAAPRLVREIPGHTGGKISEVAFAADSRAMVTAGVDGVAKRWRVGDDPYYDEFWRLYPATRQLRKLDVSSDGGTVAVSLTSSAMESEIEVWNRHRRVPVATHKVPWEVQGLALLANGRTLAYVGDITGDKRVELRDVDGTSRVRSLGEIPARNNTGADIAVDRDATTLAVVKGDNRVWLYNLVTGAARCVELGAVRNGFGDVRISPDGRLLAAYSLRNQSIVVYDLKSETVSATLLKCTGGMAFSPDGRLLAAGAANRSVPIWDPQTGRMLHQLAGHDQPLHCLVFSPDGKVLATACRKKNIIKIWAVDSADELLTIRTPVNEISALAFTPDGRTLIAAGNRVKEIDGKKTLLPGVAFFSAGDPTVHGETFVFRAE